MKGTHPDYEPCETEGCENLTRARLCMPCKKKKCKHCGDLFGGRGPVTYDVCAKCRKKRSGTQDPWVYV